jgi:hypothetical protein
VDVPKTEFKYSDGIPQKGRRSERFITAIRELRGIKYWVEGNEPAELPAEPPVEPAEQT